MHKAVGYIRVSTEGQVAEGVSLAAQDAKLRAWCELNEHELLVVHEDAGISGASARKRPGLQAALDRACREKAVLVVYSLSRLARSTMDALVISERLEKSGADLASLSERLDTTSASGRMIFRLLAVLAEFEKDQLGERTRAAMGHLRLQGRRISRHVPYGHDLSACGRMLVENQEEQEAVLLMRDLRRSGLSYRKIGEAVALRGIRTKQGKLTWSPKVVRSILIRKGEVA